jgi:predicted RNA-binding protein with PUA-like domain
MKSEPDVYPIAQFKKDRVTLWTGVRNFQARGFMIGTPSQAPKKPPVVAPMSVGDYFLFYHSNAEPSACVGIGRIEKLGLVDPTQFDKKSEVFEPKATKEKPVWFCAECRFVAEFERPVTLEMIKQEKLLAKMPLLAKGSRLSIQPVNAKEFDLIKNLGGQS